jgi:hypothetical protein
MAKLSSGKYAKFISDRSGMEFPYKEMVKEWNGSRVHISEFEPKQPQLEPTRYSGDSQALKDARPARTEPATQNLLPPNPFSLTSGSASVTFTVFENSSGFSISSVTTNTYVFDCGSNATVTETSGGLTVTAGPVTQLA